MICYMRNLINLFGLLFILSLCFGTNLAIAAPSTDQAKVIAILKKAEIYIKKYGKEKAIIEFKKSEDIFMGDYNGIFFLSPLHPELIGHNQLNYKDPSGALVVREEIEKAKAGGGWLKARWRKNPQTGEYQCRKIYILPIPGNYYIGSWYHYSPTKQKICLN